MVTCVFILSIIGALFVAFNNGANDVSNAFAAAVGSKAIKLKHALLIAAILNFIGAVLLGGNVSKTLMDGIVNVHTFSDPHTYIAGMLACMVAAGCFILISTHTGLPVSSTHAIVGGMIGIAYVLAGSQAINWKFFSLLMISWMASPFLSATIAWVTLKLIRLTIYKGDRKYIMERACRWLPIFASTILMAIIILVIHGTSLWDQLSHWKTSLPYLVTLAPVIFLTFSWITGKLTRRFKERELGIEHVFKRFQAGTSCLIGFAIGSNDVANSVTPVVAIHFISQLGHIPDSFAAMTIPTWMLALGGLGMSIGVLTLGHKVMGTLGHNITLLTNSKGFSIDFSTASTIIVASVFGIPVSSTHVATGSIIGAGLEKGWRHINLRVLIKIFLTWFITVPISALFTILVYGLLRSLMKLF